jgi:hypothetical protein
MPCATATRRIPATKHARTLRSLLASRDDVPQRPKGLRLHVLTSDDCTNDSAASALRVRTEGNTATASEQNRTREAQPEPKHPPQSSSGNSAASWSARSLPLNRSEKSSPRQLSAFRMALQQPTPRGERQDVSRAPHACVPDAARRVYAPYSLGAQCGVNVDNDAAGTRSRELSDELQGRTTQVLAADADTRAHAPTLTCSASFVIHTARREPGP